MRHSKTIFVVVATAMMISCKSALQRDAATDLNNQALLLCEEGRDREAIYNYHQALAFNDIPDEDRGAYLFNLALAYHTIGMDDSAKYFFRQTTDLYPKDSYDQLISHAYIALVDNNIGSTTTSLEKARQMDSTRGDANSLLGLIYMGEYDTTFFDPQKAFRYNMAAHKAYQDGSTKFTLAKNYYYLDQTDVTLRLLKELYDQHPKFGTYLGSLIMVEQELYHTVQAEKLMKELKQIDNDLYYERLQDPVKPGTHDIVWRNQ